MLLQKRYALLTRFDLFLIFLKCDLFHDLVQGYVIYSVRKKLKKKYLHLKGPQIKKLKLSSVEVREFLFMYGKADMLYAARDITWMYLCSE